MSGVRGRGLVVVVACSAVAAVAGAGVTFGQAGGDGDRPLRACVDKKTGTVSVVSAGRRCGRRARALTWNIRGRTGPAGAAGPQGERGSTGVPGPDGSKGAAGSFEFDSFDGMPCDDGSGPGTVTVSYDSDGFARFQC